MGMRPMQIRMPIFERADKPHVKVSFLMLKALLEGLTKANVVFLRNVGGVPKLYKSGVKYTPEKGTEEWLTIPYVLSAGKGDCEDLAAWRAAEYIVAGIPAKPDVRARLVNGVWRAHAIVRLPDGRIDDPSIKLGMKGID